MYCEKKSQPDTLRIIITDKAWLLDLMHIIRQCVVMMHKRLELIERELMRVLPGHADISWLDIASSGITGNPDLDIVDLFCEPSRDLIRRGGKRWRPLLMVLVCEMLGGEGASGRAYQLSPVVELPHTGSLIIDDIEDGSDMRRGEPAVHMKYGIDLAINAGNLLYYLPTICIDQADIPDAMKLQVYQIYSAYLRRVHFGQGFDIAWHRDHCYIPDTASYELMCRMKTGCLAAMAAEIGAACAEAPKEQITQAGRIAETLGLAFQIIDDVRNLETGNPGKRRGDDLLEGKKSLPLIIHLDSHPDGRKNMLDEIKSLRTSFLAHAQIPQDRIEAVIGIMQDSGAVAEARNRAEELFGEVVKEVHTVYPNSAARKEFLSLVAQFMA